MFYLLLISGIVALVAGFFAIPFGMAIRDTQFGSGWCWLAVKDGKIVVAKTANGESPLVHGGKPILGCDVWEHSYYIDYRNRRPDYLKAYVDHLVNWDYVAELLAAASK